MYYDVTKIDKNKIVNFVKPNVAYATKDQKRKCIR